MPILPLVPSLSSPPSAVTRQDLYTTALCCRGLCGLIYSYSYENLRDGPDCDHITSGLQVLLGALETLQDALDPCVSIEEKGASHVHN